ncbi:hypothetical protein ABIF79_010034 [Bradyrhizobium japonicum]
MRIINLRIEQQCEARLDVLVLTQAVPQRGDRARGLGDRGGPRSLFLDRFADLLLDKIEKIEAKSANSVRRDVMAVAPFEVRRRSSLRDFLWVATEACRSDFGRERCADIGAWVFVERVFQVASKPTADPKAGLKGWANSKLIRQVACGDAE